MDAAPPKPYVVYIAYASEDRWIARRLANDLRAAGAQPWFDVWDIHGRRIDSAMLDGVRRAAEMIVVASQEAVSNAYVAHEVGGMALAGKPVTLGRPALGSPASSPR